MSSSDQARLSEDFYRSRSRSAYAPSHAAPSRATHAAHAGSGRGRAASRSEGTTPAHAPSRSEGVGAYHARRRKRGRGVVLRVLLVTVLVVILGAGTAVASYLMNINSRLNEGISAELRDQLVATDPQEPFYMLLLGVDKSDERSSEWGSDTSNFRADTIILARIDPPAQKVTLVSIPRDTIVDMGEHGEQKINAAYSYGGAAYMTEVVSDFAGVDISHYAELDFEQFTSIVDTIGGIEVNLPVAVSDTTYAGIDLPAGVQTLNGQQALGLCRSRHAYDDYGGGDFYRAANQRMVIAAIVKKVLQLDVASMTGTVSELANSVTTDFGVTDILSLALQFRNLDPDTNIYSGQTPTTSAYENSLWIEKVNEKEWKAMMERVKAGESPYSDASQDFTAGVAGSIGDGSNITDEDSSGTVEPAYTGSVLVLNGTDASGLALNNANTLINRGFTATAENANESDRATTAVFYNASRSGARAAALGVAETLDVDSSAVTENDGTYSTSYDVIVVLGLNATS